jgi:hypothetical protein
MDPAGLPSLSSAGLHLDEMVSAMADAWQAGKKVVRLHTGDPSLYGAIFEQMAKLAQRNIPYTVIPGVTAAFAAAAALGVEYTLPEVSQTLILTRMAGRTPVPDRESLASLAAHRATMAVYLSISMVDEMTRILSTAYGADGPVRWFTGPASPIRKFSGPPQASWPKPSEKRRLPARPGGRRSRAGCQPGCPGAPLQTLRPPLCPRLPQGGGTTVKSATPERTAIWALTPNGVQLARHRRRKDGRQQPFSIAETGTTIAGAVRFARLKDEVDRQFDGFRRHVFIMATGIVVRSIAGHLVPQDHGSGGCGLRRGRTICHQPGLRPRRRGQRPGL